MSGWINLKARFRSSTTLLPLSNNQAGTVICNEYGALYVAPVGGSGLVASVVSLDGVTTISMPKNALCVAAFAIASDADTGVGRQISSIGTDDMGTDGIDDDLDCDALIVASCNGLYSDADAFWYGQRQLLDSTDAQSNLVDGLAATVTRAQGFNGTTWDRLRSGGNSADSVAVLTAGVRQAAAYAYVYNGASWSKARGQSTFKSVLATASGDTTAWDPAASRLVRLMGGQISVSGTLAALGAVLIKLTDGAGGTVIAQFYAAVGATITGDTQITLDFGPLGYPCTLNNNVVVNLSAAFTAGGVAVNLNGTEEA